MEGSRGHWGGRPQTVEEHFELSCMPGARGTDSRPGSPYLGPLFWPLPLTSPSAHTGPRVGPLRDRARVGAGEQGAGSVPSWAWAVRRIPERGTGRAVGHRGEGSPKEPGRAVPQLTCPLALPETEPSQPPSAMGWGLPMPASHRRPPGAEVRGWGGSQLSSAWLRPQGSVGASLLTLCPPVPTHPVHPSWSYGDT